MKRVKEDDRSGSAKEATQPTTKDQESKPAVTKLVVKRKKKDSRLEKGGNQDLSPRKKEDCDEDPGMSEDDEPLEGKVAAPNQQVTFV